MAVTEQEKKEIVQLALNEVYSKATQSSSLPDASGFDNVECLLGNEGQQMVKVPKSYLGLDEIEAEKSARIAADDAEKSARESGDNLLRSFYDDNKDAIHRTSERIEAPFEDVITLPGDAMLASTMDDGGIVYWAKDLGKFVMHIVSQSKTYFTRFPSSRLYNGDEDIPIEGKRFYNRKDGQYYEVKNGVLTLVYNYADSQIEQLEHFFESEQQNRIEADDALSTKLTDLEDGVRLADGILQQQISDLQTDVAAADATLQRQIDDEISARAADTSLMEKKISQEASDRAAADLVTRRLVSDEETARAAADSRLDAKIEQESADRFVENTNLATLISDETRDRTAADKEVQEAARAAVCEEAETRLSADKDLLGLIEQEAETRAAADTGLDERVTVLENYKPTELEGDYLTPPLHKNLYDIIPSAKIDPDDPLHLIGGGGNNVHVIRLERTEGGTGNVPFYCATIPWYGGSRIFFCETYDKTTKKFTNPSANTSTKDYNGDFIMRGTTRFNAITPPPNYRFAVIFNNWYYGCYVNEYWLTYLRHLSHEEVARNNAAASTRWQALQSTTPGAPSDPKSGITLDPFLAKLQSVEGSGGHRGLNASGNSIVLFPITDLDVTITKGTQTRHDVMFTNNPNLRRMKVQTQPGALKSANEMFALNQSLLTLDLSGFDTAAVTNMGYMFLGCSSLTSLDLSGFDTAAVTNMGDMFNGCSSLTSLDLSGFDTAAVTSMGRMFSGCSSLSSLDLSGFDTAAVTNMGGMFRDCSSLTSLDLSGFDTAAVTNMGYMFQGCSSLTSLDLSGFDTAAVTNMQNMFQGCSSLTSLDLSGFDTAAVTSMVEMFRGCSSLTSLDLSGFDTAAVTNMQNMFWGCSSLTSLDLSGFDTAAVTNMGGMFWGCSSLTSLDLSGFDTAAVTNMGYMFQGCSSLTSLDLSGFDTAAVTNMQNMFQGCSSLTSLDLSGFDTAAVTNMQNMFQGCSSLTSLDLSGFDTAAVTNMWAMFWGCAKLTRVKGGLKGARVSIDFGGCPLFDRDAALEIINSLGDITQAGTPQTLVFHRDVKSRLAPEDIAIATSKGWTVA